jgi:hypothetical protein
MLDTFTLTVRGEPFQVDAALSAHGFGGDLVAEMDFECRVRIAVKAENREDTIRRLQAWLAEPNPATGLRETPPFPIGTLLYWAPDDAAPMATYRRMQASGELWQS